MRVLLLAALLAPACAAAAPGPRELSNEQLLGQLFMIAIDTAVAEAREADIRAGRLGGALLRWDRFTGEQAAEFSARMQDWARSAPHPIPFWIAADHEGGPDFTQRLYGIAPFPGNMALGAAGSEPLAYRSARAVAEELRGIGVHVNFAPVLDVNINHENPIIGVRSFGEDPKAVWSLGAAALQGYRDGGILASVKHFPGHGRTHVDSHIGLPVSTRTLAELDKEELAPFRAAIAAGAEAVMPAHMVYPALGTAADQPVTLSSAAIEGFLRGRLGFKGVVFSDSMDMGAIASVHSSSEAAIAALLAGQDVVLLGKADYPAVFRAALSALESGRLPRAKLEKAAARVLAAKRRQGLFRWKRPRPVGEARKRSDRETAREAAGRAATVLREGGILPLKLKPEEALGVVLFHPARFNAEAKRFLAELEKRHPRMLAADLATLSPSTGAIASALEAVAGSSVVILGSYYSGQPVSARARELMGAVLAGPAPVVSLSLMYPYDLQLTTGARAAVALYGVTDSALEAGARLLFGEIPPKGRLPVSIPGLAKRGEGLRR